MKVNFLEIEGLAVLEPVLHGDQRGYFFESFNERDFNERIGKDVRFVQDNESCSSRNVLRGLHYQVPPFAQAKLIRVIKGEIFDVAVDLRKGSPTFGEWYGLWLSSENKKQFFIPEGFAHGFLVASKTAQVFYKVTNYYSSSSERCIVWDDPTISVDWPLEEAPNLSNKDRAGMRIQDM